MRRSYNYTSSKASNTAVKAATASVIIILLLAVVCIGELITLAVLNIRLKSLKEAPPPDGEVIGSIDADADTGTSEVVDQPAVIPASVQLAETADYGMEYIDKIIFVGKTRSLPLIDGAREAGFNEENLFVADSFKNAMEIYSGFADRLCLPCAGT